VDEHLALFFGELEPSTKDAEANRAGVGLGFAVASGTEDPYPGTTGVVLQGLR
jgi:hypothetical protein